MRPISELITERDMLDFSQGFNVQRNYLGSRLFPDQKTQYIEAEYSRIVENGNLPTVAMIHGFDTEAHIASRVPFERVVTEQLLIKEKINLTERLRLVTRGLDMQMDSVRRYCFDDVARMAESVVARVEKAKMEALSTGKMTINENNVSMEVDFGVPSDQKVATKWAVADADIIGDIDKWVTIANGKGQTPTVAITSKKVFSLIQRNAAVQKAIFGINGAGKTTTVGKIASAMAARGKNVVIGSADTFRAAAIEQLDVWGQRAGVPVIKRDRGSDPASVCYDVLDEADKRGSDLVLIDTAGRLHTSPELMRELAKVVNVTRKRAANMAAGPMPVSVVLVIDAATGQNGLNQALEFNEALGLDGIIMTKLDGTAKGGIAMAVAEKLKLPILRIGVGEQVDDLQEFNAKDFCRALVGESN